MCVCVCVSNQQPSSDKDGLCWKHNRKYTSSVLLWCWEQRFIPCKCISDKYCKLKKNTGIRVSLCNTYKFIFCCLNQSCTDRRMLHSVTTWQIGTSSLLIVYSFLSPVCFKTVNSWYWQENIWCDDGIFPNKVKTFSWFLLTFYLCDNIKINLSNFFFRLRQFVNFIQCFKFIQNLYQIFLDEELLLIKKHMTEEIITLIKAYLFFWQTWVQSLCWVVWRSRVL